MKSLADGISLPIYYAYTTNSTTTMQLRRLIRFSSATMHLQSTITTTTTLFETDEVEQHGRAKLMFQLRYTGSWIPTRPCTMPTPTSTPQSLSCMENMKRRPKTTTTAAESEVLWQDNLAEVINRELSEAPGTRRPLSPKSDLPNGRLWSAHIYGNLYLYL